MTLLQVAEAFYLQGVDRASYAEITWTIMAAFVAVVFSLFLLEHRRDMRALHRDPTFVHGGPRDTTARISRGKTRLLLAFAVGFVLVGLVAMSVPPAYHHLTVYTVVINTFFMVFDGVMAWTAWGMWRDYQRLRAYYNRQR